MPTSLNFYTDSQKSTKAKADLSDAKVIVYEDGNDNKYTLDASSIPGLASIDDIKLSTLKDVVFKYQLKGASETPATGLGSIIGALFATQGAQIGKSVLAEEVAKTPVVEAIFDAKDGNDKISETKVGATFAKKTDLDNKTNIDGSNATEAGVTAMLSKLTPANQVAKIDGSNATEAGVTAMLGNLTDKVIKISELPAKAAEKVVMDAITASPDFTNKVYIKADPADEVYTKTAAGTAFVKAVDLGTKAVAEKVLDAKDGDKLVLVGTLGKFLGSSDKAKYDGTNSQTAKEFLGGKGLKGEKGEDGKSPLASEVAADPVLQNHVAKINIESPEFKRAVQEEMSQPSFEIPTSDDAALNWTW